MTCSGRGVLRVPGHNLDFVHEMQVELYPDEPVFEYTNPVLNPRTRPQSPLSIARVVWDPAVVLSEASAVITRRTYRLRRTWKEMLSIEYEVRVTSLFSIRQRAKTWRPGVFNVDP